MRKEDMKEIVEINTRDVKKKNSEGINKDRVWMDVISRPHLLLSVMVDYYYYEGS